ncbi:MAG: hypothetical protein N2606_05530 [Candidatus Omnitrophica bacterium]|nr:hypothetical protein [Candidatus Omnitrophota bacterium]
MNHEKDLQNLKNNGLPEDRPALSEYANLKPGSSGAEQLQKEKKQNNKKTISNLKVFVVYGLIFCLGVIVAKYTYDFFIPKATHKQKSNKTLLPTIIAVVDDKQTQTNKLDEPKPLVAIKKSSLPATNSYVLTGIYFQANKGYCIINDRILEEGNRIGEATVTKITPEAVELTVEGKLLRLTVRGTK